MPDQELSARLETLSIEQLEELVDALFDRPETSDLDAWLESQLGRDVMPPTVDVPTPRSPRTDL
jgi:hypothetical protein